VGVYCIRKALQSGGVVKFTTPVDTTKWFCSCGMRIKTIGIRIYTGEIRIENRRDLNLKYEPTGLDKKNGSIV